MIHRHINLCENCTFLPILTHWHKTRRLQHTSRDLDTEYEKCKHIGRHDEKVHEEKVSKPPRLVWCRSGSRARSCGGAQWWDDASWAQAQRNGSGGGAHLQRPKTKLAGRDGQDTYWACFLRAQAGRNREIRTPLAGSRRDGRRRQRHAAIWKVRVRVRGGRSHERHTVKFM